MTRYEHLKNEFDWILSRKKARKKFLNWPWPILDSETAKFLSNESIKNIFVNDNDEHLIKTIHLCDNWKMNSEIQLKWKFLTLFDQMDC
jgi:hypothetical protein